MLAISRVRPAAAVVCICIFAVILVSSSPADSQWIENGAPVCTEWHVQVDPAIVSDGSGGAIIVWSRTSQVTAQLDIYAQRLDGDGVALWALDGIPVCTASGDQSNPILTSDGAGGAIIVWEDDRTPFTSVVVQRIDGDGNLLWYVDGLPVCLTTARQFRPSIASDEAGGAFITWQDYRDGAYSAVYAQKLGADGGYLWAPAGVPVSGIGGFWDKVKPQLVSDGSGGAFFVWRLTQSESWPLIKRARLDSSGILRWRTYITGPMPAAYGGAVITSCPEGAIVMWSESREGENQSVIYAEKVDTSGTELWRYPEYLWPLRHRKVATSPLDNHQFSSQAVPDGSGGAIVAWEESGSVFCRRLDVDGDTLWAPYEDPLCTDAGLKDDHRLIGDGAGGAVVVWRDYRGIDADIYAQSVDSDGGIRGPAEGIMVCSAVRDQVEPCITGNGAGGAIIAWEDGRPLQFTDIYAHQVEYDGKVETELLSWSVSTDGAAVRIAWTLSRIEENASFKLHRSIQGNDSFIELESASIIRDGSDFSASDMGAEPGSTHIYRVIVDESSGERILFESDPVSVPAMPFTLFQNSPNPFNPSTTIRYFIPDRAEVVLEVFDVAGRLVVLLDEGERSCGYHEVVWNAGGKSSGIYFYRLKAGKASVSRKMVLLR